MRLIAILLPRAGAAGEGVMGGRIVPSTTPSFYHGFLGVLHTESSTFEPHEDRF